ncbi:MAG: alpha/beta fold hydrolase [Chloroflexi bacterium]|nr:alpha/beta fold hydrolase [Chloroflexota bacterium]
MSAHVTFPSRARRARDAGLRVLLWREYAKPHTPFTVVTRDGVQVRGVHLNDDHATLLIYCHGFLSGKNYLHIQRWAELLADDMDVITFDFRGHGESGGATTLGENELLDLDAVAQYAQRFGYQRIIVMGSSMGGAVAIRYAADSTRVDGVITLGAFAHGRFSIWALSGLGLLQIPLSRAVIRHAYATRIERARPPYAPRDFVSQISPRPLLILHGEYDNLIPLSHARALYANAQEPKQLYVIPRGAHDLENLNGQTKQHVLKWMEETFSEKENRT